VPQIDVTFDIDANGILSVSATDKATNKAQRITITASSGLSKDEVEKLVQEAEAHAGEDAARRELVEARNQADNAIYQATKTLKEYEDKITPELKGQIEAAIADVKARHEGEDPAAMRASVEALTGVLTQIGQQVYGQQQGGEGEAPNPEDLFNAAGQDGEKKDGDDTVEGEFREV
jgi:molecular chaperone DnaK